MWTLCLTGWTLDRFFTRSLEEVTLEEAAPLVLERVEDEVGLGTVDLLERLERSAVKSHDG